MEISIETLLDKTNNLYKLVRLASKRAIELNAGAAKLVDVDPNTKPTTIALEEIRQGKVKLKEEAKKK